MVHRGTRAAGPLIALILPLGVLLPHASAQTPPKPPAALAVKPVVTVAKLPKAGSVRVTSVAVTVNNAKPPALPPLQVGIAPNNNACTLELAGGITIRADVRLDAPPGTQPQNFGKLGFVQFAQYMHQRAPAGIPGAKNAAYACARSSGGWELDGNDPYKPYVQCQPGANKSQCVSRVTMSDDPGVPTEDAAAYDVVTVGPKGQPDRFRTWLVWQETDNNKAETPSNRARRYVLARIDWLWSGKAVQGPAGATCTSSQHPGIGWGLQASSGGVTGVLLGAAAGAPPLKYIRAHNTVWVPGPC